MNEKYNSPLSSRYASEYMLHLFSQEKRVQIWRRLWVALARAEHKLGLPVTAQQVTELETHIEDIDFDCAAAREKVRLYRDSAYRLIRPPIELPPTNVYLREGMVGNRRSIMGLKTWVIQSIISRPLPGMGPHLGSS